MKILTITTAAPGWSARFKTSDGNEVSYPVAVWALVDDFHPEDVEEDFDGHYQWVIGMTAEQGSSMLIFPADGDSTEELIGYDYLANGGGDGE